MSAIPDRPGHRLIWVASSDHHMGDGGKRDDFTQAHRDRLIAECQILGPVVRRTGAEVLLVGDAIDLWRYGPAALRARRLELAHLSQLALRPWKVRWVVGNHDEAVNRTDEPLAPFDFCQSVAVREWNFWHGHQHDPNPALWRKVGKGACRFLAWVGSFSPAWEDWLNAKAGQLEGKGRFGDADHYREAATKGGTRKAVIGHTHRAEVHAGYVNTGTWAADGWTLCWDDSEIVRWRLPD